MNYPFYYPTQSQQNTGIISVRDEDEARCYPVAPGVSLTFKNETAPYIYTKTMGLNQFDRPVFEKYRYEREEIPAEIPVQHDSCAEIREAIETINARLDALEKPKRTKKEVIIDE